MFGRNSIALALGRKPWGSAFLLISTAFLSGFVLGVAAMALLVLQGSAGLMHPPEPGDMLADLKEDLGLSESQDKAMKAIFRRHHSKVMQTHSALKANIEALGEEMMPILTPEQGALWRERFNFSRQRWMPIRRMWWVADSNEDGLIDMAEFLHAVPGATEADFQGHDSNGDGVIDLKESQAADRSMKPPRPPKLPF